MCVCSSPGLLLDLEDRVLEAVVKLGLLSTDRLQALVQHLCTGVSHTGPIRLLCAHVFGHSLVIFSPLVQSRRARSACASSRLEARAV